MKSPKEATSQSLSGRKSVMRNEKSKRSRQPVICWMQIKRKVRKSPKEVVSQSLSGRKSVKEK